MSATRTELRAAELRKLENFAKNNDLLIEMADRKGASYQGRLGVHTENFITQNVGDRKLIVHDKELVGKNLLPGKDVKVQYLSKNAVHVTTLGPQNHRGISR